MKTLSLSILAVVSLPAFAGEAPTTLEFALTATTYRDHKEVPVSISEINDALAAAKAKKPEDAELAALRPLPLTTIQATNDKDLSKLQAIQDTIYASSTFTSMDLFFSVSGGFQSFPATCYRGEHSPIASQKFARLTTAATKTKSINGRSSIRSPRTSS